MDDAERDELKARIAELEAELAGVEKELGDTEDELEYANGDISSLERDLAEFEHGSSLNITQGHIIALRDVLDGWILTPAQNIEVREILDFIKGL